jgi:hypothetical protein
MRKTITAFLLFDKFSFTPSRIFALEIVRQPVERLPKTAQKQRFLLINKGTRLVARMLIYSRAEVGKENEQ